MLIITPTKIQYTMGASLMGIATKANEKLVISSLINTFPVLNKHFDIQFEEEQLFEYLINRKPAKDIVDIYSTANGSLVTMSFDIFEYLMKEDLSNHFDFIYFDISETSNSHRFAFFSGGDEVHGMNIFHGSHGRTIGSDNFLNIGSEEDIFAYVFPRAVDEYLPKHFHHIDLATKINRYRLRAR